MLYRSPVRTVVGAWSLLSAAVLSLTPVVDAAPTGPAPGGPQGRLIVHEDPKGGDAFAISLTADLPEADASAGRDIVVVFDTSASQVGLYRDDSLTALSNLLSALSPADRVQLVASDVRAVDMTDGFVPPTGPGMDAGLAKLNARVPLGSTNLPAALTKVTEKLAGSTRTKVAILIGDGVSNAKVLTADRLHDQVADLVAEKIPVSAYAIGVTRDAGLLAAIANHTGGVIYVDSDAVTAAADAGRGLAAAARATVLFPTSSTVTPAGLTTYPAQMPPLRSDRDTILVGHGDDVTSATVKLDGTLSNGSTKSLTWTMKAEPSPEASYLPQLVAYAAKDGGATLPTVGTPGLEEAGRIMLNEAERLAQIGRQALLSGDTEGASHLADAALAADPGSDLGHAIRSAASGTGPAPLRLAQRGGATGLVVPADAATSDALAAEEARLGVGNLLERTLDTRALDTSRLRARVDRELIEARDLIGTDAKTAAERLKLLRGDVERALDIDPEAQQAMIGQINGAIRDAQQRAIYQEQERIAREQNLAAAVEQAQLLENVARQDEMIRLKFEQFNSLLNEGRYEEAYEQIAQDIRPIIVSPDKDEAPVGEGAFWYANMTHNVERISRLREVRYARFIDALYQTELSHVPFPDEPPLIYPDPDRWKLLSDRRQKYKSVDLAESGTAEARILAALDQETDFDFISEPLRGVVDQLEAKHDIQIELDTRNLETLGITEETEITRRIRGISLRSALRLLLNDLELKYIIKDEVLLITSPEEADAQLITKVYPVGDLVIPIMSGMSSGGLGGMGGMMNGGGMGGGMGGMGGGMGGMGGGMGGMGGGFGGGMGGGFMQVADPLRLTPTTVKDAAKPAPAKPIKLAPGKPAPAVSEASASIGPERPYQPQRLRPTAQAGESPTDMWARAITEAYRTVKPGTTDAETQLHDYQVGADIRSTSRQLMAEKKAAETVALIQGALRAGHPQPWMYEGLVLALQAEKAPKEEVERALMSAADMTGNVEDLVLVAMYLSGIGSDDVALSLLQDVATVAPARHETFVQGLKIARRLHEPDAVAWACDGVLSRSWPADEQAIEQTAMDLARGTLVELRAAGQTQKAEQFARRLNNALIRDVRVEVSWTGQADVDIVVQEPTGTLCSVNNPRSTAGGVLIQDGFATNNESDGKGYREIYECAEAFPGTYKVLLTKIWGKITADKVTVDIYTNYRSKGEQHTRQQIPLDDQPSLCVFELNTGRRDTLLEQEQIASAIRRQAAVSQEALRERLALMDDTSATRGYEVSQGTYKGAIESAPAGSLPERRSGARAGRDPGYRPVITVLPSGAFLSAQAVISADRRYVRITAIPFFSSIGQVRTFNFSAGTSGTSNQTSTTSGTTTATGTTATTATTTAATTTTN